MQNRRPSKTEGARNKERADEEFLDGPAVETRLFHCWGLLNERVDEVYQEEYVTSADQEIPD